MICQCTIADGIEDDAREQWAARCQNEATTSMPLNFTRHRIVYVMVCPEHFEEYVRMMDAA